MTLLPNFIEDKKMKTLIIGDLHGNLEVLEHALSQRTTDRVVFVGDYLDSFNRSVEDQVLVLSKVLKAVRNNPERFTALVGNHELSYMNPTMKCSGWNFKTDDIVSNMLPAMEALLEDSTYVGEFLVTHAGVNAGLLEELDMNLGEYLNNEDYYQIGKARGGFFKYGGLFWNDFNMEFEPIPNVKQIMGHTHYRLMEGDTLKFKGSADRMSFNVDCIPQFVEYKLGDEVLVLVVNEETSEIEELNLFEL